MKISVVVATVVLIVTPALAQTTDGQTPSREMVCDGLSEAAFGLCTEYCEAMDCDDTSPLASATACAGVFNEFIGIAGVAPPCLSFSVCPCFDSQSLVATYGSFYPLSCTLKENVTVLKACESRGSYASTNVMRCSSWLMVPNVRLRRVEDLDPAVARACMREIENACIALGAADAMDCP